MTALRTLFDCWNAQKVRLSLSHSIAIPFKRFQLKKGSSTVFKTTTLIKLYQNNAHILIEETQSKHSSLVQENNLITFKDLMC